MASKAWKLAMSLMLGTTLYCPAPAQHLRAAEPASKGPALPVQALPPADDDLDLLEFLGGIDAANEDKDWLEFLKNTDIGKVAGAKAPANPPEGKGK